MSDSLSTQPATLVPAAAPVAANPASAPAPADDDIDALTLACIQGNSRGPPTLTPALAASPAVVALHMLVQQRGGPPTLTMDALALHFVEQIVPMCTEYQAAGVDEVPSGELVCALRLCAIGWSRLVLGSIDGGAAAIRYGGEHFEVMTFASLSATDPVKAASDLARLVAFPCNYCPDLVTHNVAPLTNTAIGSVIDWLTPHLSNDPTLPSSTTDPLAHFALYIVDLSNISNALHQNQEWDFQPAMFPMMQLRLALPKPPGALPGAGYRAQLLAAMADIGAQSVDPLVDLIEETGVVAFSKEYVSNLRHLADYYAAAARSSVPESASPATTTATGSSTRPLPPKTVLMVDANSLSHTVDLVPHLDHPWFALNVYGSPEGRFRWQRIRADPNDMMANYQIAWRNQPGEVSMMMLFSYSCHELLNDAKQPALLVSAEESVHNIKWLAEEKRQQVAGAAPVCIVASELGLQVMAAFLNFVITGHDPVLASHARWVVEEGAQEMAPVASGP